MFSITCRIVNNINLHTYISIYQDWIILYIYNTHALHLVKPYIHLHCLNTLTSSSQIYCAPFVMHTLCRDTEMACACRHKRGVAGFLKMAGRLKSSKAAKTALRYKLIASYSVTVHRQPNTARHP